MPKVRWVVLYGFVANFVRFPTVQTFYKTG